MKIESIFFNAIRRLNVKSDSNDKEVVNLNRINIFIGENGSGKSTIIDMIRSLKDLSVIPSLPKENPLSNSKPYYGVIFDNNDVKFVSTCAGVSIGDDSNALEYFYCYIEENNKVLFEGNLNKFDHVAIKKELSNVKFNLPNEINYKDCNERELSKPSEHYISELNRISTKLSGAFDRTNNASLNYIPTDPNMLIIADNDRINTWLEEDKSMPNILPISWFPSGWRAYAEICAFLNKCRKGSICLLEEPEVNLHPRFQRLLVNRINELSIERDLQILFSTHSPAMINVSYSDDISIFHTKGGFVDILGNERELIEDLGYKASDIFQSNCVIWVEGPSDRIYINHWLSGIDNSLIEGVDYSFLFYGGRVLSHFELQDNSQDMISMLRINRNSIIVMDSDKSNPESELNDTKKRIISSCNSDGLKVWVTHGREIENYLDPDVLEKAIEKVHPSFGEQLSKDKWSNVLKFKDKSSPDKKNASKVKVAKEYVKICDEVIFTSELKREILDVYKFIINVNK
ncbi:AAA family ATPase [Vibrio chagasii]|nr:AAA family ATPase [Vibrio chagasii]CAH7255299.1 AAA family ATPase [Vibrio chagasii]CAH7287948.1 AAA family ATPase [Vibrio chagasii]